ncbi:hypothetical protein EMCRGX_G006362 [Ephydatia muelleri]
MTRLAHKRSSQGSSVTDKGTTPASRGQRSVGTRGKSDVRASSVLKGTIETDNKMRQGVLRKNSTRFEEPSPPPPDPNSEAKSETIRRMQRNLEEWNEELKAIHEKKMKNETIQKSELAKRDERISKLTNQYTSEHEVRTKTERERSQLSQELAQTTEQLDEHTKKIEQLEHYLAQYKQAFELAETKNGELEYELQSTGEQLKQSEGMRKRLQDQVTELQGQLAIEEQRSRFCVLL